jgi:hypothetical protein
MLASRRRVMRPFFTWMLLLTPGTMAGNPW